jgi:cysteine-rich repeat protein
MQYRTVRFEFVRLMNRLFWVFTPLAVWGGLCACDTHFSSNNKDSGVEAECGDGLLGPGEACDDGNLLDGDGCDPQCVVEAGWFCEGEPSDCVNRCGNGTVDPGEFCDGNELNGHTCETVPGAFTGGVLACSAACRFDTTGCILPGCGDGVVDMGEECDDANDSNEDACLNNCTLNQCGDGYLRSETEECDDGNTANDDGCTNTCDAARCGDGYVWSGHEECDDGNTAADDACTDTCQAAICGDGIVWSGHEECDDGNNVSEDSCTNDCTEAKCGDGIVWSGREECDDGDNSNRDGCTNDCKTATCGDGHVWSGYEACDDGNNVDEDECTNDCEAAQCGDGIVWSDQEECDDGNSIAGDGCGPTCQTEDLPVLHWVPNVIGGWSNQMITYADDPHAPVEPVVAAAGVWDRDEAYVFTASTFHVYQSATAQFVDHGNLNALFTGVPGSSLDHAHGASGGAGFSYLLLVCGTLNYQYRVEDADGAVSEVSGNPVQVDWSGLSEPKPELTEVKAVWHDPHNNYGWISGDPSLICGDSQTSISAYMGVITDGNMAYFYDYEYCLDFFESMWLEDFTPFNFSFAPAADPVVAAFYNQDKLYVISQP